MSAAAFESKRKTVPLEKDISSPTISSRTRSPFSLIATDLSSNRNNIRKMTRSAQDDSILSRASSYRPPHAYARMGPSNRADGMPPFCWKAFSKNRDKRGKIFSHAGQPDCFDFAWQAMPPPLREWKWWNATAKSLRIELFNEEIKCVWKW